MRCVYLACLSIRVYTYMYDGSYFYSYVCLSVRGRVPVCLPVDRPCVQASACFMAVWRCKIHLQCTLYNPCTTSAILLMLAADNIINYLLKLLMSKIVRLAQKITHKTAACQQRLTFASILCYMSYSTSGLFWNVNDSNVSNMYAAICTHPWLHKPDGESNVQVKTKNHNTRCTKYCDA